jgi:hypothetical protein
MRHLKIFEDFEDLDFSDEAWDQMPGPEITDDFNLIEVNELDYVGSEELTGDSVWITDEELDELKKKGLVHYENDLDTGKGEHYYISKNSDEIEEELELMRTAKNYNL